jgi:hypothetical protein
LLSRILILGSCACEGWMQCYRNGYFRLVCAGNRSASELTMRLRIAGSALN